MVGVRETKNAIPLTFSAGKASSGASSLRWSLYALLSLGDNLTTMQSSAGVSKSVDPLRSMTCDGMCRRDAVRWGG